MIGFWTIQNFTSCKKNDILNCLFQIAGKHSTFSHRKTPDVVTSDVRIDKWQGFSQFICVLL